jgi:hypothetical protein
MWLVKIMLSKFVFGVVDYLYDRGWRSTNALMFALMFMLLIAMQPLSILMLMFDDFMLLPNGESFTFRISMIFDIFFIFLLSMITVINYYETRPKKG